MLVLDDFQVEVDQLEERLRRRVVVSTIVEQVHLKFDVIKLFLDEI